MTDCKPIGTSGICLNSNHLGRANAADAKEHAWKIGIRWCGVTINVFARAEISSKVLLARQLWKGSETETDGTTLEVECDASSAMAITTRRDDKFGDAITAAVEKSGTSMYMQQVVVIHTDGCCFFDGRCS